MRAANEYQNNAGMKRGVVVDRDPSKMRAKVEFKDEDGTVSLWLDALSRSSGKTKSFIMPDVDDEVWCMLDHKGEDGCIVGSKYNSKDAPPFSGNDDVGMIFPGGSMHLDRSGGALTLNFDGEVRITAPAIILIGDVHLGGEGGKLIHRKGDADSAGDTAVGSATKVYAL